MAPPAPLCTLTSSPPAGITSSIKDAQALSVTYLAEVVQVAGRLPGAVLLELLGTVLEGLSSTEAPALQYLQLHSNAGTSMHSIDLSSEQLEGECERPAPYPTRS